MGIALKETKRRRNRLFPFGSATVLALITVSLMLGSLVVSVRYVLYLVIAIVFYQLVLGLVEISVRSLQAKWQKRT